ncbi:hypothetical protein HZC53_03275 [Candidatus Uhrbacteria bacterium]|nr:hypothetical protein [Candidatus Uhrbacteria bacterium]
MNTSIKAILISGIFISLFGAGCGNSTTQTTDGGKTVESAVVGKAYDPCALLTVDDVKAFYPNETITVKDDKSNIPNPVGQRICFFDIGDDMKFVQLSIIATADMSATVRSGGLSAEKMYYDEKQLLEGTEPVTGLGDEAYYGGSGLGLGKGTHVLVKNKGVQFGIDIGLGFGNTDKQKHLDIESALAKKVLERL